MKLITAAMAALVLAACTGTRDEQRMAEGQATTAEAAQAHPIGAPSLDEMTRNAESQAGELTGMSGDELRLRSYPREGGSETRLELSEPAVPVFKDGARVGRDALRQGEDVRIFYESGRGAKPRVIAVEVLTEDEARRLRESR
jgi:hypothetical protein